MRIGSRAPGSGFTLIEMMAVIVILALVVTLVGVNVADRLDWAKVELTKVRMRTVGGSLEMYRIENQRYPTSEQGLYALVERPRSGPEPRSYPKHGYLEGTDSLEDAWSRPLGYESPGTHRGGRYDLWSLGGDGEPGGEGSDADITNWEERQRELLRPH